MRVPAAQVASRTFHGIVRRGRLVQPPKEKCAEKARANDPKPPRVTLFDPESGVPPDDAWLVPVSLEKKLERDDQYPPWAPPDDPVRPQSTGCGPAGAAMPGDVGSQLPRGISA
jgi:hypothetical protein